MTPGGVPQAEFREIFQKNPGKIKKSPCVTYCLLRGVML